MPSGLQRAPSASGNISSTILPFPGVDDKSKCGGIGVDTQGHGCGVNANIPNQRILRRGLPCFKALGQTFKANSEALLSIPDCLAVLARGIQTDNHAFTSASPGPVP